MRDGLKEWIGELITRPGHEKVRTLIQSILTVELGASSKEVTFEERLPVVHGRLDALLGYTILEFKSNLDREKEEAERQTADYLTEKERQTGHRHTAIVTDGKTFYAYGLLEGSLLRCGAHSPSIDDPRATVTWLDSVLCLQPDIMPEPVLIRAELGRHSIAWHVAKSDLRDIWGRLSEDPECQVKRSLWAGHLARVYGTPVDSDDLFFQHTYLSIVAKTVALHVTGLPLPPPDELVDGAPFVRIGIVGAVEADFFDWPLRDTQGRNLIHAIAAQVGRFRFDKVEADVLKGLYESLIDPEQRHDLGEYYTPDWLAEMICQHVIDDPLRQRVLDPSCGSGTFLFHAVRLFMERATAAGIDEHTAIEQLGQSVLGIDVHPLAVQIARVTYLLAIGANRLVPGRRTLIPVYMGDSLQWNTRSFMGTTEVVVTIPGECDELRFPFEVASQPDLLDKIVEMMVTMSKKGMTIPEFREWLATVAPFANGEGNELSRTYGVLARLQTEGKDHVWAFVVRNLTRPLWLSAEGSQPDRIVGNPPWLSFRYMSQEMQDLFRSECGQRELWVGGKVATQQDISAYFLARCAQLYFKETTKLGFVMPYSVMSRQAYKGFLMGKYGRINDQDKTSQTNAIVFEDAWTFPDVQPLFPVPSCVLFCRRPASWDEPALPATVRMAHGALRTRDATAKEFNELVHWKRTAWPAGDTLNQGSLYRHRFKNGATVFPRMLTVVVRSPELPRIPYPAQLAVVESRRTKQEKKPWKDLPSILGSVEQEFARDLYLGESITPFRALQPELAVIPWIDGKLVNWRAALVRGFDRLSDWLYKAEKLWDENKGPKTHMTLLEQMDFYGKLSSQFPIAPLRVVFAASGTNPTACTIRHGSAVIEHNMYWAAIGSEEEATYLCAVLNSTAVRAMVNDRQSRGQWGPRHFDKIMFSLPIPIFNHKDALHQRLAELGTRAEKIAAKVAIPDSVHFVRARRLIREALRDSGVTGEIDAEVAKLIGPAED